MAKNAELSTSYVSLIESGRRVPSASAVRKLARGLRVPASLLTLLATDAKALPKKEAKALDELGRALLALLIDAG